MKLYRLDILRYDDRQLETVAKLMGFKFDLLKKFQGDIEVCFDQSGFCLSRIMKKHGFVVPLKVSIKGIKETTFTNAQLRSRKSQKRSKITRLDLRKYNYEQLEAVSEILKLNLSDLASVKPKADEVWFYDKTLVGYSEKKSTKRTIGLSFQLTNDIENLVKNTKLTTFSYKELKEANTPKTGINPLIDESAMSPEEFESFQETKAEVRDIRIKFGLESGQDWVDKADEVAFKGNKFDKVEKKTEVPKEKIQQSIDKILEKIGSKGMDSLTKKELDYLKTNSKKL